MSYRIDPCVELADNKTISRLIHMIIPLTHELYKGILMKLDTADTIESQSPKL